MNQFNNEQGTRNIEQGMAADLGVGGNKKPSSLNEGFAVGGRDRTSTEQLVVAQSSVVDPGRIGIATETALCYIYPVTSTPETRGSLP